MKKTSKNINTKTPSTTSYSQSRISPLLLFNISMYTLAAICFMIYTTELNYAHADEDLGSASSSIDASVTVGTACNFSGNVDIPHTSTIMNGINSTDIGKTTLNVTCNDQGGYAVYAIGYTNDEYGNTALQSSISEDYNISTGTSTSGSTSNWAMKLSTVSGTTTATIENGYSNYSTVPDDYTKVATLNTITNPGTSTTGSSISTTYQTYISPTQPAGAYTGKVKYTLVHPSTAPTPEKPVTIADAYKASGAIKTPQGYYKMQDMNSSINNSVNVVGDSLQVQDSRDNKIYWITKLADGNIWMTQNLDLDIEAGRTYTAKDTDLSYSSINTTWTPSSDEATYSTGTTTWNHSETTPRSYDPGNLYWDGTLNTSWSGNLDNETVTDPSETSGGTHYHIGNYYNWTAAVAMSNSSSYTAQYQDVNQSICPAGWRLPVYNGNKSYQDLINAQQLISGVNGNIQNNPTYFLYGGEWYGESFGLGSYNYYWSNTVSGDHWAFNLHFNTLGTLDPKSSNNSRGSGIFARCVTR